MPSLLQKQKQKGRHVQNAILTVNTTNIPYSISTRDTCRYLNHQKPSPLKCSIRTVTSSLLLLLSLSKTVLPATFILQLWLIHHCYRIRVAKCTVRSKPVTSRLRTVESSYRCCSVLFSSSAGGDGGGVQREVNDGDNISVAEAKKLMRLLNVEALKTKFVTEGKEVIGYSELLQACESTGVAKSVDEAKAFASVLDEAGVVLMFRDKVYLHPDKVVDLVRRAVPLALAPDDDPRREELKTLQAKQEEIDRLAHKQVRWILYSGLGFSLAQVGLFFRLTFWEFSWDVMEPIAFFATASSIIVGYAYFLITSRDPTYQDLMKRLFLSRRRKLMKKHKFDVERFVELQKKCKSPLDAPPSAKHDVAGVILETQDLLHKN